MARNLNFDELQRMFEAARVAPAGGRAWMAFAVAMMDSWPALNAEARAMATEQIRLRDRLKSAKEIIEHGVALMHLDQLRQWDGARIFLESIPHLPHADPRAPDDRPTAGTKYLHGQVRCQYWERPEDFEVGVAEHASPEEIENALREGAFEAAGMEFWQVTKPR